MNRSLLITSNLLVLGALWGISLFVFDEMPDRIPVHFGGDGLPDRFADRSLLRWLTLPVIAAAMSAGFYGLSALLPRMKNQISVPEQKLYRALSDDRKMVVVRDQIGLLFAVLLGMNLMMTAIQAGTYEVAMGRSAHLPAFAWISIALFTLGTMVLAVRSMARSSRLIKRLAAEESEDVD